MLMQAMRISLGAAGKVVASIVSGTIIINLERPKPFQFAILRLLSVGTGKKKYGGRKTKRSERRRSKKQGKKDEKEERSGRRQN